MPQASFCVNQVAIEASGSNKPASVVILQQAIIAWHQQFVFGYFLEAVDLIGKKIVAPVKKKPF